MYRSVISFSASRSLSSPAMSSTPESGPRTWMVSWMFPKNHPEDVTGRSERPVAFFFFFPLSGKQSSKGLLPQARVTEPMQVYPRQCQVTHSSRWLPGLVKPSAFDFT